MILLRCCKNHGNPWKTLLQDQITTVIRRSLTCVTNSESSSATDPVKDGLVTPLPKNQTRNRNQNIHTYSLKEASSHQTFNFTWIGEQEAGDILKAFLEVVAQPQPLLGHLLGLLHHRPKQLCNRCWSWAWACFYQDLGFVPEQISPSLNSKLFLIGELPVPNEDEELLTALTSLLLLHQLAIVGEEL